MARAPLVRRRGRGDGAGGANTGPALAVSPVQELGLLPGAEGSHGGDTARPAVCSAPPGLAAGRGGRRQEKMLSRAGAAF